MHGFKMEQLNEIINLTGIDILLIIIFMILAIILIILELFLKKLFGMNAKIQVLEKLNRPDRRDIQIQTEEFDQEPIQRCFIRIERDSLRFSSNKA